LKIIIREEVFPFRGNKDSINAQPFVTPSKQVTMKMKLLQQGFIQEPPKPTHEPPVQPAVILIHGPVDHIEVTS
jgi:hypothetical protein